MLTGKVIAGKVLVKPLFEDVKTTAGIIVSTTDNVNTNVGIVVKVGEMTNNLNLIEEGNKVMLDQAHCRELTIENTTYYLLYINDIHYIF